MHQAIGISRGGRTTKIHTVVDSSRQYYYGCDPERPDLELVMAPKE
jgi:hypothetical protein